MSQSLRTNDCPEQLIERYAKMVFRLAFARMGNQSDADDIFQEVFFRYLKKRPVFESEEHCKAWLLRTTINCSKNAWASSWYQKTQPMDASLVCEDRNDFELYDALMHLPVKYRTVMHLFYYEDLNIQEISELLHERPSTVRTQLTRARAKLKETFKEE